MSKAFDVAVIGGGPAGCATALSAMASGLSVVIIDRSKPRRVRVGEVLPPAVQVPLKTLRLWERFLTDGHLPSPAIRIAWGGEIPVEQNHFYNPHGVGWHINRARFDGMMARAAKEAGVCVILDATATCQLEPSAGWVLEPRSGRSRHELHARFLVDATGRQSAVARQLGLSRVRHDNLIGVTGCFGTDQSRSSRETVTLIEAAANGWWYSASVPEAGVVVCYLTDADLHARSRHQLERTWLGNLNRTALTRKRLEGCELASGPFVVASNSSRLVRTYGREWVAVGDAAVAFDPLAGQGIYRALESGIQAGRTVRLTLDGDLAALAEYGAAQGKLFDEFLRLRTTYYSEEKRWPASLFWRRRRAPEPDSATCKRQL